MIKGVVDMLYQKSNIWVGHPSGQNLLVLPLHGIGGGLSITQAAGDVLGAVNPQVTGPLDDAGGRCSHLLPLLGECLALLAQGSHLGIGGSGSGSGGGGGGGFVPEGTGNDNVWSFWWHWSCHEYDVFSLDGPVIAVCFGTENSL